MDWHASYYLKEFDKIAPKPGADWMKDKTSSIAHLIDAAREKGWVVKTRASEAKVGSIAICRNAEKGLVKLYIVREVYDWGFKAGYIGKDGEAHERELLYTDLLNNKDDYTFRGYIWPERGQK